jgi:hypothetical protein
MSTTPKISFTYKIKTKTQFQLFVQLCNKHSLQYFQFYDHDSWRGPVTKVTPEQFDHVMHIFETCHPSIKTILLHGHGFVIIKPIQHIDDSNIHYPVTQHNQSLPIIPFNSDDENDTQLEHEFQPEPWKYNNYTYLLDTINNYLYEPSTLEFIGKKTGEFSIDYEAKEA